MINILSSRTIYDKDYAYNQLKTYIKPESKICVIAFSFFNTGFRQPDYEAEYSGPLGKWYLHILEPLLVYGIKAENVSWIIYNKDNEKDAKKKIDQADIIFLPGGAPDLFHERLKQYNLVDYLSQQDKTFMGPSAGTMVQFNWFHISKDRDYKKYMISDGIGLVAGFGVEVHFRRRKQQKKSIRRVSHYNERPVYTIHEEGFMILKNGQIEYSFMANKYYEKGKKIR